MARHTEWGSSLPERSQTLTVSAPVVVFLLKLGAEAVVQRWPVVGGVEDNDLFVALGRPEVIRRWLRLNTLDSRAAGVGCPRRRGADSEVVGHDVCESRLVVVS